MQIEISQNASVRFKLSMCTTYVPSHINITYLLLSKNFTFMFYAYLISRHIGNWT